MPMTVISLKNAPLALRGDLSKWTQEISRGVYVGNFNSKVRESLWERIKANIKNGEACISYSSRNELGYSFEIFNSDKETVDFEGIKLVKYVNKNKNEELGIKKGFSSAYKFSKAKNYGRKESDTSLDNLAYTVIDIETDGIDSKNNSIIEIAAIKISNGEISKFNSLILYNGKLPVSISNLTGISNKLLDEKGRKTEEVLKEFKTFIDKDIIVGYNIDFDIKFINNALNNYNMGSINNITYDLLKFVKKEKQFLNNYKLQTALNSYGINEKVPHRALGDSELIYSLSLKVKKFLKKIKRQSVI